MSSAVAPKRRSVAEALADPQNLPDNIAAIGNLLNPNQPSPADGAQALRALQNHPGAAMGIAAANTMRVTWGYTTNQMVGHPLDGSVLYIEGELMSSGQCNISVARPEDFNVSTEIAVYSPEEARTEFEAHPNKEKLDPPASTRSHQEPPLKCRKCGVFLPPDAAVRLLQLEKEGKVITARYYFTEFYPTLTAEEKVVWKPVTEHFQVMAVAKTAGETVSEAELAATPSLVRVDEAISKRINASIYELIPERRDGGTAAGLNQLNATLAVGLDRMDNQHEMARREAREKQQRKEEEKKKKRTMEAKLGEIEWGNLKRYLEINDESDLAGHLVWAKFAEQETKTAETFRKCLQACVDEGARQLGIRESAPTVTLAMATGIMNGEFYRRNLDDPATGWFSNFLLHGEQLPSFTKHQIQRSVAASAGSQLTLTPEQSRDLLRFKTLLPPTHEARRNVQRMLCVAMAVFPRSHPFLAHLRALITQFDNHYDTIKKSCLVGTPMENATGVIILEAYGIKINAYFRKKYEGSASATLGDPGAIFDKMENREPWVPHLNPSYQECLGLKKFNVGVGDLVLENMLEDGTGAGVSRVAGSPPSVGPPPPTPSGGGGQPEPKDTKQLNLTNPNYNEALFGEFRNRKGSNGRQISLGDWKKEAIARNPLPKSKFGLPSMCLAWHSKGLCNSNCRVIGDHQSYSASEYQPLVQWCQENWPAASN